MRPEELSDFSIRVTRGDYDEWLGDLFTVLKNRQDALERKNFRKWAVGDEAELTNLGMGSKYMIGQRVKVVDVKLKRLVVVPTDPMVTFRGARRIVVYPNMLKPILVRTKEDLQGLEPGLHTVEHGSEAHNEILRQMGNNIADVLNSDG
jgi:hypothetical protein